MLTARFFVPLALVSSALGAASCGAEVSAEPVIGGDGGVIPALPDGATKDSGSACDAGPTGLPDHRAGGSSCSTSRSVGIASDGGTSDVGSASLDACTSDADCTAGTNGRCAIAAPPERFLLCSYDDCSTDSDCAQGAVCVCGTRDGSLLGANTCMPSTCAADADCGSGFSCAASGNYMCANYDDLEGFYCHSAKDECQNDCDCAASVDGGGEAVACRYVPTASRWTCVVATCTG